MGGDSGAGEFTDALAELKRRGSGVLVVGETGDGTHLAVSRRLLGQDDGTIRRRVVVLTDSPATAGRRIPQSAPPDACRVIDHRPQTRSASSSTSSSPSTSSNPTTSSSPSTSSNPSAPSSDWISPSDADPPTDLDRLEREILDAIEAVCPADSFAPAELRVCVDSLRPLVTDEGVQSVATFLSTVLSAVRDRRGMAHAHLPVAYDAPLVGVFAPSFDAVVQVRPGEQRWHLTGDDCTTQWLPV